MHRFSGITQGRRRAYDFSDAPGTEVLVSGRRAVAVHERIRTADARSFDAMAFDASAGGSALSFFVSQLALIDTDLTKPLEAVTHPRDITVKVGGGWPQFIQAWASNYATTGTRQFGLQGTNNTEVPIVQADVQTGQWTTFIWNAGMAVSLIDMKRMEFAAQTGTPPPFTLQGLYDDALKSHWGKSLDYVTYFGWNGQPGLMNNAAIPEIVLPNGASSSSLWKNKTPQEILYDVNLMQNTVIANAGYDWAEGMPNRMLIPYTQYALLTAPMTISNGTGVGFNSIKDYIEKMCVAAQGGIDFKIHSLPNNWISGQGSAGLDRSFMYKETDKSQYIHIPQPMTKFMGPIPTTRIGAGYETIYAGCISQVIFKRTITSIYGDGL